MSNASKPLDIGRLSLVAIVATAVALLCRFQFKTDWLEVAGFVTGVVGVYLVAVEHIWNWPVGIVNVLLYAYVFYSVQLYADVTLQLVFFALAVVGWVMWLRGGEARGALRVSRIKPQNWFLLFGIIAIGTLIYKPLIEHWKGASPFWDTLLMVVSLCAQVLLNAKKVENWVLWIFVDIAYIPLYISRGLYPTAILYFVFLILAVTGLLGWLKTYKAQTLQGGQP